MTEEHTKDKLAGRLERVGRYPFDGEARVILDHMVALARQGYYHDYLSPLTMPDVQLVTDLRKLSERPGTSGQARTVLVELVRDVISGSYAPSTEEAEAWIKSPEGQAALDQLPARLHDMFNAKTEESERES